MALVTLNGVEVECTDSEREPVRLGEVVRSLNGIPRSTQHVATKRIYRFTTGKLSVSETEALQALIDGDGDVLSFDDTSTSVSCLYSSREVLANDDAAVEFNPTAGRYGTALLLYEGGNSMSWSFPPSPAYTLLVWLQEVEGGSSGWMHYIHTYSPEQGHAEWRNGVRLTAPELSGATTGTNGVVMLSSAAGVERHFDDVVRLPYAAPESWAPGLYAFHNTRAWPRPSHVWAEGPRFPTGGLLCVGQAGTAKAGPRLTSISERFDFTLYGT